MARDSSSGWSSDLFGGADTIVARGSAAGPAALAVIRLSGPDVRRVAASVSPAADFKRPWQAQLVTASGAAGQVVAIPYVGPRSYTGEDMLELMVHGSPFVVESVIKGCLAAGARQAAPGEFTRRAVANGKMDLIQAEAVRDLVAAETAWQARNAREQLGGRLSARLGELRRQLVELLARLEATLDFIQHGVEVDRADLEGRLARCRGLVAGLLETAAAGERIRDGARVVIAGRPNSGKSTLFNRLLGSERAIVTATPGTTRDVLEAELEIAGLLVTLVDTAGLRPAADAVEEEGVRRARAAVASAAVLVELWPADGERADQEGDREGLAVVRVRSKADLLWDQGADGDDWLRVSCVTGEGLEQLRSRLAAVIAGDVADLGGEVAIGQRHRRLLERAAEELARSDLDEPELAAESLALALRRLAELLGDVATDDVLEEIFGSFCIGK